MSDVDFRAFIAEIRKELQEVRQEVTSIKHRMDKLEPVKNTKRKWWKF